MKLQTQGIPACENMFMISHTHTKKKKPHAYTQI